MGLKSSGSSMVEQTPYKGETLVRFQIGGPERIGNGIR